MKRMRDIILDFTPLLDITLIILFYFILFSHMGAAEAQQNAALAAAAAEAAQSAAADMMAEAEQLHRQAENLQLEADRQLAILAETEQNQAATAEAMQAFARGENLKLRLLSQADGWSLRVQTGDDRLAELAGEALAQQLTDVLQTAGYLREDVILCEFAYTATESGSYQAYRTVHEALDAVRAEYQHLYISETDLST